MLSHGINKECYKCLCRVCGQAACPHRGYRYKRCFGVCVYYKEFRPILDCDNFYLYHFPKYRIKRVFKSPKIRYIDKTNADDIRVMLSEILSLLKPKSAAAIADVNCLRNECICLTCPLSHTCKERCDICIKYKGQHPVKLCAKQVQYYMNRK